MVGESDGGGSTGGGVLSIRVVFFVSSGLSSVVSFGSNSLIALLGVLLSLMIVAALALCFSTLFGELSLSGASNWP